jgi:hypothetical protein
METVVATAISGGLMATAVGLYVGGTRGFHNEQARTYAQLRTRTVLDRMATDARGATAFLSSTIVDGVSYTASSGPSPAACLILQVPSQDAYGLLYYGVGTATPQAIVTDTVIYYINPADQTLRRTVVPAVNVVTNDAHSPRTSYRSAERSAVIARNVQQFTLVLKNRDGTPVAATAGPRVASIDFQTQILGTGRASGECPVSVTGVRLRNMRSGSIPGCVMRNGVGVPNAVVKATYTSTTGAYPVGTIVISTTSDAIGTFELYGLMEGTYSVTASPTDGAAATVTNVVVGREAAASSVTVNVPPQV